jgi:TolA-binding protein
MADNSGNFWGGFLFGAAIGGAVGALVAIKLSEPEDYSLERSTDKEELLDKPQNSNEFARRNLEKKIAQLNAAIDSVSQELVIAEDKNGRKKTSAESLQNLNVDLNGDDK